MRKLCFKLDWESYVGHYFNHGQVRNANIRSLLNHIGREGNEANQCHIVDI